MSLRSVGAMLLVLAAVGCARPTEPDEGLEVLVELSSDVFRPGEPLGVTITAVNRGTLTVPIIGNPCQGANGAFVVTTADGTLIGPGEALCTLVGIPPRQFAPGEQIVIQTTWEGDSRLSRTNSPPVYVDPGEYQLRGQILTTSGRVLSAPASVRVLQ